MVSGQTFTVTDFSENAGVVGSIFGFRQVTVPLQISSSMTSAAHLTPVISAPLMGSTEWAMLQKLDQDFLKTIHHTSMGWFD